MDAPRRPVLLRTVLAMAAALAFALGVYLLLQSIEPVGGVISFSFLLILPAALSAFVAFLADPWRERRLRFYMMIPVWLLLAVIVASAFILREGVICIVMLSPLWLGSGMFGAWLTWRFRPRASGTDYDNVFSSSLLVLPLLAMAAEPYVPLPQATPTVTRSIVVAAPPARIWPLLEGIPDVRPDEGGWNVSQDLFDIPRPVGARLVGKGIGADRYAVWQHDIRFRERVTEWQPGARIGWRFIFDDIAGWGFTDRHLMPDSPYFRVTDGGYTLEPLSGGRTRVTLHTRYRMQTPVNPYGELWGQLFLGDLENNLLTLVKGRAEAANRH